MDGSGRLGRVLKNLILVSAGYVAQTCISGASDPQKIGSTIGQELLIAAAAAVVLE